MEKGKISAVQLGILMYPTILATAILAMPEIMAVHARSDLWISPVWASLLGFLAVFLAIRLHALFPNETVIQYSQRIAGKIAGRALGLLFLLFYLHVNSVIVREYAEFLNGVFLAQTPMIVVISSLVLLCSFAVRGGIEVIGRSAQFFFPFFIFPLLLMTLALIPDYKPANVLPFLEKGVMPSLKGAVAPAGWFSEMFMIAFFLPFVKDRKKVGKWAMLSVIITMLTMMITNLVTLFILGNETSSMLYPVMTVAQYVSIADFFENMESVVMAVWVMGAFVKVSAFYYVTVLGTAQWLQLSDSRPITFPIGLLTVLFAFWGLPNAGAMVEFLGKPAPFYLLSLQVVIPALLLMIALIRRRWK